METQNAGIDYGCGLSNIDHVTGIRYGVISQNEVLQSWADSSEPFYIYTCPYCGTELKKKGESRRCPSCHKKLTENDFDMLEPVSFFINDGEYSAEQSSDDPDIFITKSPYFTLCQYCSPCAPGAGYLMSPMKNGIKAYCFSHDFFEPEQQGERPGNYGRGIQNMKRTKVDANGSTFVICWVCDGKGYVPNMISKAPYPVYSVETGELIQP